MLKWRPDSIVWSKSNKCFRRKFRDELIRVEISRNYKSFRERYLKSALGQSYIEMTNPDKPNSRLQR